MKILEWIINFSKQKFANCFSRFDSQREASFTPAVLLAYRSAETEHVYNCCMSPAAACHGAAIATEPPVCLQKCLREQEAATGAHLGTFTADRSCCSPAERHGACSALHSVCVWCSNCKQIETKGDIFHLHVVWKWVRPERSAAWNKTLPLQPRLPFKDAAIQW